MSDPLARGLTAEKRPDKNGRVNTKWVKNEELAARAGSQSNGFLSPSVGKMPNNTVPGVPVISANGTKSFFNVSGQLHRVGGLPAVEYLDGRGDYYENGECFERCYPGTPYDTGLCIDLAHAYIARTRKFEQVYSSYTRPAVSGPGRVNEYWIRGVKLRDEASWNNAKKLSHKEFDDLYGMARVPVLSVSERFERLSEFDRLDDIG